MELLLNRKITSKDSTLGDLYINGKLFCFTLEDPYHEEKIKDETRIPEGRYEILIREDSPMARRYKQKYGTKGMLWLQDVPGYSFVYLHAGNTSSHTSGCILVGYRYQREVHPSGDTSALLMYSGDAYKDLFLSVHNELNKKEKVFLTII